MFMNKISISNCVFSFVFLLSSCLSAGDREYEKRMEGVMIQVKKEISIEGAYDYSGYSANELLAFAISPSGSITSEQAIRNELIKREDETKEAIKQALIDVDEQWGRNDLVYNYMTYLPVIAGDFGIDYQAKIAKEILFHSRAKLYDFILIEDRVAAYSSSGGGLLTLLEKSPYDETAVIDRLVEEGRVKAGSDFEKKWRRRLTRIDSAEGAQRKNTSKEPNQTTQVSRAPRKDGKAPLHESAPSWTLLLIGGLLVFALTVLLKGRLKKDE